MIKKLLVLFGVASASFVAQAQSEEKFRVYVVPDNSPILVGGAATPQIVYNQPVAYAQPSPYAAQPVQYVGSVQYNAPVQYYAPVQYSGPSYTTVVQNAPDYSSTEYYSPGYWDIDPLACYLPCYYQDCSSVQVIYFGEGQAQQQGYHFNAPR